MTFSPKPLVMTLVATGVAVLSACIHPAPKLIWNASASVPIGLYLVLPVGDLAFADLVVVQPPDQLASFLADGGYLPRGLPLLKQIAALPGQTVCREGTAVTIDDVPFGNALAHDRLGRRLPVWQGCLQLGHEQVFLLNPGRPDSLDGRYFGPLPATSILGRATPLWTFGEAS